MPDWFQALIHRWFHNQVRSNGPNTYICHQCYGRIYKAGWASFEEGAED